MKRKNPSFIARRGVFGPKLWDDCYFDASKLWKGVEVNSLGASIVGGAMFAHYDTRQALTHIQCPIFLALGRCDYFNPPGLWEGHRGCGADLTIRVLKTAAIHRN